VGHRDVECKSAYLIAASTMIHILIGTIFTYSFAVCFISLEEVKKWTETCRYTYCLCLKPGDGLALGSFGSSTLSLTALRFLQIMLTEA
jgi:hypothetical protein